MTDSDLLYGRTSDIRRHTEEDFEGMRKAGRLVAECLDMLVGEVKPGVTTAHLDKLVEAFVGDHGAVSATINYRGYRHASCISVNHVICHGIPGERALRNGDIANIDVTLILDGWHGDHSRMYVAGKPKRRAERLMDTTYEALMAGIGAVKPGNRFCDISITITEIAKAKRLSVVEDFCGHGLGRLFHDEPNVVHSWPQHTYNETGRMMRPKTREEFAEFEPGMFFTIEPMLNIGRSGHTLLADGWTAVTKDRELSAQFEHSVGVTETGVEIFTKSPAGFDVPYRVEI